jgi:membrane-bound serine protease (ClpP class)
MENLLRIIVVGTVCLLFIAGPGVGAEPNDAGADSPAVTAAVIVCKGMIDDGLFKSIQRRTQMALDEGVEYLIYEIQTYGGLVQSADDISKYFILDIGKKAHTVAYVTTEAISAGAMISVSCQDIIMLENTKIGDCAPITLGGKLEGVEREKTESFIRTIFVAAAEANSYPAAMLKAMDPCRLVTRTRKGKFACSSN